MLDDFRAQTGFRSLTTLVDRETGECLGISLWERAEAERASRALGGRSRDASARAGGGTAAAEVAHDEGADGLTAPR